jgi:phospholipase/carboxylesterase
VSRLQFAERPAAGPAEGLLIMHHGRGADEQDLLPLAGAIDPQRRLHVVTPRAPLQPPGSAGHHWYLVPRVGHPDPDTFWQAFAALAELHDELWERTGIGPERTIVGGFSMGTVMSYALAYSPVRPAPAGVLAFSGFMPAVEGWEPDLAGHKGAGAFIAHGERDQVIDVRFAREAAARLRAAAIDVDYHESPAAHHIDPRLIPPAASWLRLRPQAEPGAGR